MDWLFFVIISFVLLLVSAIKVFFCCSTSGFDGNFDCHFVEKEISAKKLNRNGCCWQSKKKSVIAILLLIGAVMAASMAAATVPVLVDWGISSIDALYFIFEAFILTSVISVLL